MKYSKYRPTEYRFLPTIPEQWMLKSGLAVFEENKIKNKENRENLLLQFSYGTIIRKPVQDADTRDDDIYSKYSVVKKDDIVINGLNLNYDFVSQRVGKVRENGIITSAYIVVRCRDDYSPEYFTYLLKSLDAQKIFHGMGSGIRLTLGYSEFSKILFPVPPRSEQDQIVRYLDWKVSCINRLIHGYQRQIELCRERKRLLVNQAILGGLSKCGTTQDSGIEWIGKIPCNWKIIRCKNLFTETNERSIDGTETHLSMSQKLGLVPDDVMTERRMLSESYAGGKICYKNDLVLNRLKAHLGVFALARQKGVISPDYTVFKINTDLILPEYAEIVLKSDACRGELVKRVRGITVGFWRLYTENFNTIVLPVPNIDEQKAIMNHLNECFSKIDNTIDMLEKEITLLREYRTRLISDVVTGQIDVRDEIIPDYTPEADTEDEDADTAESEVD